MSSFLCFILCYGLRVSSAFDDGLWMQRIPSVLPRSLCRQLIRVAEKVGFPNGWESIDSSYESSYIDVYSRDRGLEHELLWPLLEPIMPKINDLVHRRKLELWHNHALADFTRFKTTTMDWIFLRRYSPETPRDKLRVHDDHNMFTVSVELNTDYQGGGFFVLQPNEEWISGDDEYFQKLPPTNKRDYDYLQSVRRVNTSEHIFPGLESGDILIYNYSVFHGVAPIESGSRYSLLIFYDMTSFKNFMSRIKGRQQQVMIKKEKESVDEPPKQIAMEALFINLMAEDEWNIDLFHVQLQDGEFAYNLIEEGMHYGDKMLIHTFSGHIFRAVHRETNRVVAQFVMDANVATYEMTSGAGF